MKLAYLWRKGSRVFQEGDISLSRSDVRSTVGFVMIASALIIKPRYRCITNSTVRCAHDNDIAFLKNPGTGASFNSKAKPTAYTGRMTTICKA